MTDVWFAGTDPDDPEPGVTRARMDNVSAPTDQPAETTDAGFAVDENDYYTKPCSAMLATVSEAVAEYECADDVQLAHAARTMDNAEWTANELTERVIEWTGTSHGGVPCGLSGVRDITVHEPKTAAEERVVSYATRTVGLLDEHDDPQTFIGERTPTTASNLAEMAGPILMARLTALAGGFELLAKKSSGMVQTLGAEDVLFVHLKDRATSLKHGVIFVHEHVRGIHPGDHGSAIRAFTGEFATAVRADYYSGDYRSDLHAEPVDRMKMIRTHVDEGGDK